MQEIGNILNLEEEMVPINVSHVSFADDLMLIAEASLDQALIIHDVLAEFCSKSSQKVNLQKSKVFFSKNLRDNTTSELCQVLGMESTHDIGIYLGAPMVYQRATKIHSLSLLRR